MFSNLPGKKGDGSHVTTFSTRLTIGVLVIALFHSTTSATIWWRGVNGDWDDATKWSKTSSAAGDNPATPVPINGNNLIFNIDGQNSGTHTTFLQGDREPRGLEIRGSVILNILRGVSGAQLRPGVDGINITGSGQVSIDAVTVLRSDQTWTAGDNDTAKLIIDSAHGSLNLQGYTLTVNGGGETDLQGTITGTGTGSLIKGGGGVLILRGTNSYGGTTTINNGVLKLAHTTDAAAALGDGELIFNGGTLRLR
jgi:autotransporter-associated beta strand protein